jgi:hypothetical protein
MVFEKRNPGLWELKVMLGVYYGHEGEEDEPYIVFSGPNVEEYNEILKNEMGLSVNAESGVEFDVKLPDGSITKRKVAPDVIERRSKFLCRLIEKHIKDHNFSMMKDGKEVKLENKEVWAWTMERPEVNAQIVEDWRNKIPLAGSSDQKPVSSQTTP